MKSPSYILKNAYLEKVKMYDLDLHQKKLRHISTIVNIRNTYNSLRKCELYRRRWMCRSRLVCVIRVRSTL